MRIIKSNLNKFVDEKFGVIKKIYDLPNYSGLPRIFVKMSFGSSYATSGFNASGAGITKEKAKNAAIGEYIERYSLLHPNTNLRDEGFKRIFPHIINPSISPNLFNEKSLHWQTAINLIDGNKLSLPLENIYLSYRNVDQEKNWITTADGAACGRNTNEIIWKCIAEILERDAFVTNWRYKLSCEKISIFANQNLKDFFERYIKCDPIKITLYKLTMDWSIPTVFGVAELPNGGCVVAASTRDTWIEACKKTLVELSQSLIGYASVLFNDGEINSITDYTNIKEYQDHSNLYFSDNMARHLDFFDSGKTFIIPEVEADRTDKEKVRFFLKQLQLINRPAYYLDVTSVDILPFKNWHVGRVIIPDMLDVEPNYIPKLTRHRLIEAKENMIRLEKKVTADFHEQPKVPHPFP